MDPERYTVLRLLGWKEDAEQAALDELEGREPREPEEPPQEEGWTCPFCQSTVGYDQHVCLGCQAEVVHGATRGEREEAARAGLMLGGLRSFLLFLVLPGWLSSYLPWQAPLGLGLGIYALPVAGALALLVAYGGVQFEENRHRKNPPRFFRSSVS